MLETFSRARLFSFSSWPARDRHSLTQKKTKRKRESDKYKEEEKGL